MKIFLVDDHKIFVQSFRAYIEAQQGIYWTGSADGRGDLIREVRMANPDLILLDFHLPDDNGLAYLKKLRAEQFRGKIVFLTMNRDSQLVDAAKTFGADGFVNKDVDGEQLVAGLLALHRSEVSFLRLPEENLLAGSLKPPFNLTPQEQKIARMVCSGMDSETIAGALSISIHTVHTHRRRILDKTGSKTFHEVRLKLP